MFQKVSLEEFLKLPEREPAYSDWLTIDQERINQFADATNDHQFIHIDPERAKATPMGATIAHGFLTLSLISHLTAQNSVVPETHKMTYNYGMNKMRFLSPVKVNSRVRSKSQVQSMTEKKPGQWLMQSEVTIEIEGEEKPALVAESLAMVFV